jgi:hypothetical protein
MENYTPYIFSRPFLFSSLSAAHSTDSIRQKGETKGKGRFQTRKSPKNLPQPAPSTPLCTRAPGEQPRSLPFHRPEASRSFQDRRAEPPATGARRFKLHIGGVGARFPACRIARAGWRVRRRFLEV